jgi:O-antigen/teichoic acid export membrane protein
MSTPAQDGIGGQIRSGVAWKAGSQITLQLSRMVVALVLARMLAPHDWGLAAMVLVFSSFVVVFTDNALGTALIQRRELVHGDRSTVFWVSVGAGAILTVAGIALARPIAHFYGEPDVVPLFVAASVGFFVSSLGTTHMALLIREMRFRSLELRQIAATVVGATLGISLAVGGFGAWAIVGQMLAEIVVSTVVLWVVTPWRPSVTFSTASLRRLGAFAGNVFGENLCYQAGRSFAGVLVGRLLGAAALGTYTLATTVILIPFSRLAAPLQQVFFPAFSRIREDRVRIAQIWLRATRLLGSVALPALVGLIVVAPEFVHAVLGDQWDEAIPVIRILAVVGIVQALHTLNVEVLLALGKAGVLFRLTLLWALATAAAIAVGSRWGIVGVAAGYTLVTLLIEPLRAFITARALGISFWRFPAALSGVAQATAIMGVAAIGAREALLAAGASALVCLVGTSLAGLAVYAVAVAWRAPEVVEEVKSAVSHARRRDTSSDPPLAHRLGEDAKTLSQRA